MQLIYYVLPSNVAGKRCSAQFVRTLVSFSKTKSFQKLSKWNVVVAIKVHGDHPKKVENVFDYVDLN